MAFLMTWMIVQNKKKQRKLQNKLPSSKNLSTINCNNDASGSACYHIQHESCNEIHTPQHLSTVNLAGSVVDQVQCDSNKDSEWDYPQYDFMADDDNNSVYSSESDTDLSIISDNSSDCSSTDGEDNVEDVFNESHLSDEEESLYFDNCSEQAILNEDEVLLIICIIIFFILFIIKNMYVIYSRRRRKYILLSQ